MHNLLDIDKKIVKLTECKLCLKFFTVQSVAVGLENHSFTMLFICAAESFILYQSRLNKNVNNTVSKKNDQTLRKLGLES